MQWAPRCVQHARAEAWGGGEEQGALPGVMVLLDAKSSPKHRPWAAWGSVGPWAGDAAWGTLQGPRYCPDPDPTGQTPAPPRPLLPWDTCIRPFRAAFEGLALPAYPAQTGPNFRGKSWAGRAI